LFQQFLNESKVLNLSVCGLRCPGLQELLTVDLSLLALFVAVAAWLVQKMLKSPNLAIAEFDGWGVQPSFRVTFDTNVLSLYRGYIS
jgi:hypothetical protein